MPSANKKSLLIFSIAAAALLAAAVFLPPRGKMKKEKKMNERNLASSVVAEVKKAIVGKDPILVKVLAAILLRAAGITACLPCNYTVFS